MRADVITLQDRNKKDQKNNDRHKDDENVFLQNKQKDRKVNKKSVISQVTWMFYVLASKVRLLSQMETTPRG